MPEPVASRSFLVPPFAQVHQALDQTAIRLDPTAGWDPSRLQFRLKEDERGKHLDIGLRLEVDLQRIWEEALGSTSVPCRLAVVARADDTRWSHMLLVEEFDGSEQAPYSREHILPLQAGYISREVVISVVLARATAAPGNTPPGTARHAGNILAEKQFTITTRAPKGREFPSAWVSFKAEGLPEEALWHLKLPLDGIASPDPDSFVIQLNADVKDFQRLLSAETARNTQLRFAREVLLKQISISCVTSLLVWASRLESPPLNDPSQLDDTLWSIVLATAEKVFEDIDSQSPAEAFQKLQEKSHDIEANVQAWLEPHKVLAKGVKAARGLADEDDAED